MQIFSLLYNSANLSICVPQSLEYSLMDVDCHSQKWAILPQTSKKENCVPGEISKSYHTVDKDNHKDSYG